jgi:glycosyltransferase involved in cell wall biosynthesis
MKIVIDNSALYLPKCGIQRYAECVIEGLIEQLGEEAVLLLPVSRLIEFSDKNVRVSKCFHGHFKLYDKVISAIFCCVKRRFDTVNAKVKYTTTGESELFARVSREILRPIADILKVLFPEKRILRDCFRGRSLYHNLHGFVDPQIKPTAGLSCIITIFDLIPLLHPEILEGGKRYDDTKDRAHMLSLSDQDVIITISEYSKQDICRFNDRINPDHVHAIPLAASQQFKPAVDQKVIDRVRRDYEISSDCTYALSLLTSDPKKNVEFVVRAFVDLFDSDQLGDLRLVLTGRRSALQCLPVDLREKVKGLGNKILITGFVDDDDFSALISEASFFCFPSLYEGFGLPILESMQCGTPVVSSNCSSLPEVAGEAALLVDPANVDEFKQAVLRFCNEPELREQMSENGIKRAAEFTWEKCVAGMIETYRTYSNQ